jgi:hypothetical protein
MVEPKARKSRVEGFGDEGTLFLTAPIISGSIEPPGNGKPYIALSIIDAHPSQAGGH